MKSEELIKVIKQADLKMLNEGDFGELDYTMNLVRDLFFMVGDNEYCIEWFTNLMTLKAPCGMEVKYTNVKHSGTWPNHFKRNLQFYYGEDCVAIIGIEKYPELIREQEQ